MGKYSNMKISDMYETLCKELCCEMEKFEENANKETLGCIKDLLEAMNELQEIEAGRAMREFADERWGYDMDEGLYPSYGGGGYGGFPGLYNAGRNGGRGGRGGNGDGRGNGGGDRGGNGGNRGGYGGRGNGGQGGGQRVYNDYPGGPFGYPTYGPNRGNMWPNGMPDYMRQGDSGRINRVDGGDDRMGRGYEGYDDDQPYMLRQENGRPRMTPYAMHDGSIPKKLTAEECKKWMDSMENEDGTDGPKYDRSQVEEAAKKAGVDYKEYGLETLECAVNMMYSDYCEVAKRFGVDRPEFWVAMADSFLMDTDFEGSPKEKLAIYYHMIAQNNK